jgi:hypothetical protein
MHARERRNGRATEVPWIPGVHGGLIGGFPRAVKQGREPVLRGAVALPAQVTWVEERHVDIVYFGGIEAAIKLTPDDVTDHARTDPRVGQAAGGHGAQRLHQPRLGTDAVDQLVDPFIAGV